MMETVKSTKQIIIVCQSGGAISLICFITQILFYILLPCSRKADQKILTQMTISRLVNVVLECVIMFKLFTADSIAREVMYGLYVHSDCALICWMFIFTKNLYDKVVQVFVIKKISFALVSVLVWVLTLPMGIIFSCLLHFNSDCFDILYKIYTAAKFIVLAVNLGFFIKVYIVALSKKADKDVIGILRTCVVAVILVIITCLQMFIPELILIAHSVSGNMSLTMVACIVKAYQVCAMTTMFVILVNSSCEESITATIAKRFVRSKP